ncbi:hypothetical protein EDD86DRAFT_203347 [Gorgonomyces haynaldii]|nr:hypothetical protein EDD86DRAFT_203347 [Gorgonomyces haynaldii]
MLEIASHVFSHLSSTYGYMLVHAVFNAFHVRKTSPPNAPTLRGVFCTIILAYGGGILTNFILARPQTLFFNPVAIPIYSLGYLLIENANGLYSFLLKNEDHLSWLFQLIDAMNRGAALPQFLFGFRNLQAKQFYGRDSIVGQFLLGTLSITGGGLTYVWIFRNNPYSHPGWSLYISMLVVLVVISLLDANENQSKALGDMIVYLGQQLGLPTIFSVQELKLISFILLWTGFMFRPRDPAPIVVEEQKRQRRKSRKRMQSRGRSSTRPE